LGEGQSLTESVYRKLQDRYAKMAKGISSEKRINAIMGAVYYTARHDAAH